MNESVGRINLDLGVNYNKFNREMNGIAGKAEGIAGGAFKKLGGIIAAAFAVKEIIGFGREAINLASDLNEVQNVVDVTFGAMAGHVNAFAKTALQSFGLSELSAKRMASTMGAMLKSSGITGNEVVKLSESMTGLAADFASFYNLKPEEAFDKIRSGISGETEPLKQLGINMNVANLEAYALSQGIKKSYMNMTQAEQVLLRYNYLLNVSKDAQGDFARTSNSWANQTRLLSEQWKIFQGTMGQGFINILTPVIRGLNGLILKLQTAAAYFKAFTEMIFGSAQTATAGSAAIATVAASASNAGSSVDDMGKAAGGAGKATKKAGKEIKGALAGFDQLNTISQKASGSLSDAAGGIGGLGNSILPDIKLPEIKVPDMTGMKNLMAMFKGIDLSRITKSFDNLVIAVKPLGKTLFDGLKWAWDNILVPLGKWVVNDVAPAFVNLLAGAFTVLNPLLLSFQPLALFLWDNFLKPIAAWTGGVIVDTMNLLADALTGIGHWMTDNQTTVDVITTSVVAFFAAWEVVKLMAFVQMAGGVTAAINLMTGALYKNTAAKIIDKAETIYLTALYAKDFVVAIGLSTIALAKNTGKWIASTAAMVANKVIVIATTIAQYAMTAATIAWNIAAGIGTVVTTAFGVAVAILTSPITLVIAAIALLVGGIILLVKNWDKVKAVASNVWEGIKSVWKTAYKWMYDTVIAPIGNAYFGLWNGIINGMNWMIRGLNKIKIKIPDWVPSIGGKGFGITIPEIPKIPKLAGGGLVSSPTLAMVGDNKNARIDPEVVSPLSKLQDMIVRAVTDAMAAMNQNNHNRNDVPAEIILMLGETELGRATIKAINKLQRQAGKTLLNIR